MNRSLARPLALVVVLILGAAASLEHPGIVRADATVDSATVENGYPKTLTFRLQAHSDSDITDVALVYAITGSGNSAVAKPTDYQAAKKIDVPVNVDVNVATRFIPVGSEFSWHFDLTTADGKKTSTPDQKFVYLPTGQDWKIAQSDVMVIYYHGDKSSTAQNYLKAGLDTYDKMAKKLLGIDLKVLPVRVVMFNDTKEAAAARQSQGTTYDAATTTCGTKFAINVIHVTLVTCGDDPTDTLRHEFTHVINETAGEGIPGEKSLGSLPPWLDEGTAVEGQLTPGQDYAGAFQAGVSTNRLIPFSQMLVTASDPKQVLLWYGQANAMVHYLIGKGSDKYAKLFATIKSGQRFDQALQQVYGFSYTQFESDFRKANNLPDQAAASPTARPQQSTATARPATSPTARATASAVTKSSDSGNSNDRKVLIIIIGVAVLFGLLAVFAYLIALMLGNNRKRRGPYDAWPPPGGPPTE